MKKFILILILISVVFIISCTPSNLIPNFNLGGGKISLTGTDLEFNFIDGQPQSELDDYEEFQVGVNLVNKAPYDIDGELCVKSSLSFTGFGGSGILQNPPECRGIRIESALEPDNTLVAKSAEEIFPNEFGFYSYKNPNPISQEFSVTASLKYLPVTISNTNVCIKKRGASSSILCNEKESLSVNQYPAPIKISKVEKDIINVGRDMIKMNLEIYLDKIADGHVVDRDSIFDPFSKGEPKIDINVELQSVPAQFTCEKTEFGKILYDDKKDNIIKCSATIPVTQAPYNNPMQITLGYGFERVIQKTINLKASNIV